ncbi:glycoside hydrolase domain-containing protein [Saccharothrix deserti]|uniref:glycoside hydrolase domain-containing protein n=1 Tax=Saccharothrix deserti TaxID=2593674 RepID=UPI00131E6AA6|nr:glycoside hydrolase domain-containing protein [Saccharothrix deserti]
MVDQKVLEAQQWVNATYGAVPGYTRCAEDGRTGWPTMHSLTRALQHELGITTLSDSFGPTTLAKLTERGPVGPGFADPNIVRIVQHALFCKGYWAGETTSGTYGATTQNAVVRMKADCGVTAAGVLQPKWFKALLTMDAYILVSGGSTEVRAIQQWLNHRYLDRSTFFVVPCDGRFSRDVQVALMKAIQYESGIPDDQATGSFGPATRDALRRNTVGPGSPGTWVQLFSAACVFNGDVNGAATVFKAAWDDRLAEYVRVFQEFSALDRTGVGDYRTWAQLLVSTGDPDRPASACDTRFHISTARAQALRAAGYTVVGRYLDEDPTSTLNKELQPGELDAIFAGGMRVFPISQYDGRELTKFSYQQGYQHGLRAHERAVHYGFNRGTVIYFAVDFDATDEQITSNVLPYFHGVQAALANQGKRYVAAVYGSRNVCARVTNQAYARYSFVSGMSYGFSGNLGFPMPANWSFNQIKEFKFTSGTDTFDLDRDVHRPFSDPGVGPENVGGTTSPVDAFLHYVEQLYATAVAYGPGDANLRVLEYLRYPTYVDVYSGWQNLIGDVDRAWIDYAKANGPGRVESYRDPSLGVTVNVDHLGATANAVYLKGNVNGVTANRGDFGGWGGDLATFYGEWRANSESYPSGYAFCADRLAKVDVRSSFPLGDLIEDVDGHLLGLSLRIGGRVDELLRLHLAGTGHVGRFARFFGARYDARNADIVAAARNMLISDGTDAELGGLCTAAIRTTGGWNCLLPGMLPADKLDPFLQGYADTIEKLARG